MDYLVKLYELEYESKLKSLLEEGVRIFRPLSPNKSQVIEFVENNFSKQWADEISTAFSVSPANMFIAVKDKKIVGFSAFECTNKCYFGPMGVLEDMRQRGIGAELLFQSLTELKNLGYAYAIIGWSSVKALPLYKKVANAIEIPNSEPSIYKNLI